MTMKMKTESIFMYEAIKGTEISDLFVKMLEEGKETLSTESSENTMEAIRLKSKLKEKAVQNEVELTRLTMALKRFKEELKQYVGSVDYYVNDGMTYEEKRLSRVISKYKKYKELFGLSDFDLDITEQIVNRFWKNYNSYDYMNWCEIIQKINMIIRIDDYINRFSTIIYDAGGKIKGYPSTSKDIKKMRFLMSVDVIVALIALEDYCAYNVYSLLSSITYNDYLLMYSIEGLVTETKLTEQGKKRCKAILDIILPEQLQPEEFKAIIKK